MAVSLPKKHCLLWVTNTNQDSNYLTGHQLFNQTTTLMINFSANQIANFVNGTVEGDETVTVNRFSKIEEADAGSLSFLANPTYTHYIYKTKASIVLVRNDLVLDQKITCTLVRVENPYEALAKLLEIYKSQEKVKAGISPLAFVSSSAQIGSSVYIGEFAFVGENCIIGNGTKIYPHSFVGDNVSIGKETILYSGVRIYHDCIVGNGCTFHSNSVIGADGFGFTPQANQDYIKVAQIGNVIIEDNVEIGACTAIDRATIGSTVIKNGVKLDNLIQVAHNVVIGQNTVIAAQTGIAGSTKVGKNCMIGGQVGLVGHLKIGDEVKIGAQSGVASNIPDGAIMIGTPAIEASNYRRSAVHFKNIDSLAKRIWQLEKKIEELEKKG